MRSNITGFLTAATLAAIAALSGSCASTSTPSAQSYRIEREVMLMRHGIRPPTRAVVTPPGVASDPWPTWSTPIGHLTEHGYAAIRLLGRYDRQQLNAEGLFAAGCPAEGEAYIHSDTDERTIRTGDAMIEGLFPGCAVANEHLPQDALDRLYSPLDEPGAMDSDQARAAIIDEIGSVESVRDANRPALELLGRVVGCCAPPACASSSNCQLANLPTDLVSSPDEGRPKFTGLLDYAPTAAQVLMLEYVEGMPMSQVGWGRVSRDDIERIMSLHTMKGTVLQRSRFVGPYGATPLMTRMLAALEGAPGAGGSKYSLFVGHDTNISDLSGMLGFHWRVRSYPANTPPPGGGVGFQLLRDGQGRLFVRAFYRSQTMDQMRDLTPLSRENAPSHEYLALEGCSMPGNATMCPLETFREIVRRRSRPAPQ